MMALLRKIYTLLFSTSAAGLYLILIAAAVGTATFIENDFGTSAAQKVIFKTRWFELLLILFGIALIANIIRFRMLQQKKWTILTFHAAMIVILLGAGVTRYFGSEGMMGIREGDASNIFLSSETYLQFEAMQQGRKFRFDEPVLFAALGDNHLKRSYRLGDADIGVEVLDFLPNPVETIVDDPINGIPILKVVIGGANGREEFPVRYGDRVNIYGTVFNFGNAEDPATFNIQYENNNLTFKTNTPFAQMVMATQKRDTLAAGIVHPLLLRSLYSNGQESFVIGDFKPQAKVEVVSSSEKMTSASKGALDIKINSNTGEEQRFLVVGSQGVEGRPQMVALGKTSLAVSYGAKQVNLPFSIKLNDFIMEKYPGTENASSYASEVTLLDPGNNLKQNQRIYMNHILNYGGYRFFQSSYDQDELGTYLSVNHDFWGTWISYLGYALLTIGMVLTFFDKKSRFVQLSETIKRLRMSAKTFIPLLWVCLFGFAPVATVEAHTTPGHVVNNEHAGRFGRILVQDYKGRLKPMNTFTSEILRKISRKEELYGQTADQIILGMATFPQDWYDVPLIKLGKHEEIRNLIRINGELASYSDFFDEHGQYKLKEQVRNAYNIPPRDRGVFEKEIIKLDEKINICSMVFSGRFMKVFPIAGDPANNWQTPPESGHHHHGMTEQSPFVEKFYPAYMMTLQKALHDNDWALANRLVDELDQYQKTNGGAILPSESELKAELLLNKLNIFSRLGKIYGLLGLVFLGLMFTSVFKPRLKMDVPFKVALGVLALGFFMHTLGLGLRWYVSGRAPWSNGYESMIYIGWTTVLAGLIFSRKSIGGLTATSVLAATIMMVAGMSWLDPEITPLVPVLKSYWLTIHVSLEAGSYGFLVLGAIIGVLNLIFMIFANEKNKDNIYRMIRELSYTSEMTLIGGLFMISIGTYLGGVWANESWGRYWGWDAKETWALVTILVYSFILHMRFIPGLRGFYAYNVATLFGWASVMMTYFGVNYYLSGLHSYAAGDPVPVPPFVYYTVISLVIISLLALWRHRWYLRSGNQ
ncbi:MAG: cytochrome C biogenesis protein [Haliscomenobacteraceae bacterium CHB4]|nr:Cytochrome c biogenesis protein CcsA [Saprospiraceae bacterium]MCE7926352.1 cytochrome C biogenesis protein [Haliscomenobacteraceae bacterium CHB4]